MRGSNMQVPPAGTVALWYAPTELPLATVWPFNVHGAPCWTAQEEFVYEPLSVPLVHERCWLTQPWPYATLDDWYAATDEPLATLLPLKVQATDAAG